MVVILNPKAELFDEVTDKLKNANKKVDKYLINDIISKIKKSRQKSIDYNERSADETESEYTRVVPEEDPNEVNEKIKETLTEFTSTYDDPMESVHKYLLKTSSNVLIGHHLPPPQAVPQPAHHRPVHHHHLLNDQHWPYLESVSLPR